MLSSAPLSNVISVRDFILHLAGKWLGFLNSVQIWSYSRPVWKESKLAVINVGRRGVITQHSDWLWARGPEFFYSGGDCCLPQHTTCLFAQSVDTGRCFHRTWVWQPTTILCQDQECVELYLVSPIRFLM